MEFEKTHIRHCLLHYFRAWKKCSRDKENCFRSRREHAVSERISKFWFSRFRAGDFDLNDKPRSGRPQEADDTELQALLDQHAAQSTRELSAQLGVSHTTVLNRLHTLGKIQEEGKDIATK